MMRLALLLLLPLLAGCYSYAPVESASLMPGESVRARISGAEVDRLSATHGGEPGRVLEGVLVDVDTANLLLQVPSALRTTSGGGVEVLSQRLLVSRAGIVELELKRLDRTRTGVLVGAGVVAVALIATQVWRGEPGSDRPPGGGDPEMIPRGFQIRIHR